MNEQKVVAVFGSSLVVPGSIAYEEARLAGTLLAQAGLAVCSGGYIGVMEAVSRGAKEAGGKVIGVTSSSVFPDRQPNRWADEVFDCPTLLQRVHTMIELSAGYLGLKGGLGTLMEVSVIWGLLQTGGIHGKPLVLLRDPWQGLLDFCADRLINHPDDLRHAQLAETPSEAVQMLTQAIQVKE